MPEQKWGNKAAKLSFQVCNGNLKLNKSEMWMKPQNKQNLCNVSNYFVANGWQHLQCVYIMSTYLDLALNLLFGRSEHIKLNARMTAWYIRHNGNSA